MAALPVKIIPEITMEKRANGVINLHLMFGYMETVPGVRNQPLKADSLYKMVGYKADGTVDSPEPRKIVMFDGSVVGVQIFTTDTKASQYINFELWEMPPAPTTPVAR